MNTSETLRRIVTETLLTGGIAVAGLGLASGTAQAFDPQPDPPGGSDRSIIAVHPQQVASDRSIIAVRPQQPAQASGGVTQGVK